MKKRVSGKPKKKADKKAIKKPEVRVKDENEASAGFDTVTEKKNWQPNDSSTHCTICEKAFSFVKRR